jgi:integrase
VEGKAALYFSGRELLELRQNTLDGLKFRAATRMADAGADAFTLMSILGHSDIRMTARYTHATNSAIKRAVANLDTNSDFSNVLVTESKRQAQGLP